MNDYKKCYFFLVYIYKMVNIIKETYENNDIEVITDNLNRLWLNKKHIEEQLGLKNISSITNKYNKEYKKCRCEIIDEPKKKQLRRTFLHNDLALKIIMNCRTDESCSFKRNLGFRLHDVINTKEQTVINSIKDAFEGEDMQAQYTVIGYMIDLFFININLRLKLMD